MNLCLPPLPYYSQSFFFLKIIVVISSFHLTPPHWGGCQSHEEHAKTGMSPLGLQQVCKEKFVVASSCHTVWRRSCCAVQGSHCSTSLTVSRDSRGEMESYPGKWLPLDHSTSRPKPQLLHFSHTLDLRLSSADL